MRQPVGSTALAGTLLAQGNVEGAERMLARRIEAEPRDAAAWNLLSVIANGTRRSAEAIARAQRAIALEAGRAEFHFSLGRALKSTGRLEEAVAAYERAIDLRADFTDAHVSLGIALRLLGRLDAATEHYRAALRLRPDSPEALGNLGNVLAERLGRLNGDHLTAEDLREAEQVQRRALALAPERADPLHNLGVVLRLTGRTDEAAALFDRALAIDGARVDTCLQLGGLLCDEARLDLARGLYEKWLHENVPEWRVMLALAACLAELGESEAALSWIDRVDTLTPASAPAQGLRHRIEQRIFDTDVDTAHALQVFRDAIAARPDYYEAVCSYLLTCCYRETDPVALQAEHRARIAPVLAAMPAPLAPVRAPRRAGRLRIGYVSHDFKRHSVAYFLEGVLESRDRARHEVFAYKTDAGGDEVTRRLRSRVDHWVECDSLSDTELAQRCRADAIDVLVDLSGHTAGARLGVFQRRPAPCQLTYLGYPTTTGADCFDFRLTDSTIDPAGSEPHGSEPLLRLPRGMFCYRPGPAPAVAPPPALARGFVTFGSFNNFSKAGPHTLAAWRDVLDAVPGARLRLKAGAFHKRGNRDFAVRQFAALGIAAQRIEFSPWQPDPQRHLAAYAEIDIALDTFPFNGATTTCEALHMGVPVVTRVGATHPSRMGASILGAAGLARYVAIDGAGYVAAAAALAGDVDALATMRESQRARLVASRLMDGPAFTRDFEDAVDSAYERCVARTADAHG
ncbi:MAG: tetratricopeptide repeat protein, partial [Betaproteobacteria bacterium]